jgi:hypothetical protein
MIGLWSIVLSMLLRRGEMTKNNPSHDVTDLLQHNSSSIEKVSCYNNITYNITEFLEYSSFLLDSRLQHDHNLQLLYLLIHCQTVSLQDASKSLKVSRALFYNQILPDNPCFLSEKRVVSGWGRGGKERRIILSEGSKSWLKVLEPLAIVRLGENECQRLRVEAEKIRKGFVKVERQNEAKKDFVKKIYLKKHNEPDFIIEQYLPSWAKMCGCSGEEILEFLGVESDGPE